MIIILYKTIKCDVCSCVNTADIIGYVLFNVVEQSE